MLCVSVMKVSQVEVPANNKDAIRTHFLNDAFLTCAYVASRNYVGYDNWREEYRDRPKSGPGLGCVKRAPAGKRRPGCVNHAT